MTGRFAPAALIGAAVIVVTLSAQESRPTFEVASVRRAVPGETGGRIQFPPGRFGAQNVPLDYLLQQVYGVRDFQIIAPPELRGLIADGRESRYYIEATADAAATPEQVKEMAKALLADRFGLRLHKEMRDHPVYALTQTSGGAKGAREANGPPGVIASIANGWIRGRSVTVDQFVEALSRSVDRPIVDRSNLTHVLDFELTWLPLESVAGNPATGCPSDFQAMASRMKVALPSNCPSIFAALQEQMGLRLDARTAPLEVLVIDSLRQPTEN